MNTQFLSASSKLRSSGFKKLGRTSVASISVLLILLISASCALAWPVEDLKITPESPICINSSDITITGKVGPGDTVTIVTTYVKELNVTNGKYEFDAGIVPIPAGTTLCSITAENVKDMTITTNLFGLIPISKTQKASSGKAALSVSSPLILPGNYSLLISGNAIATNAVANCNGGTNTTSKTVKLTFVATVEVKADDKGYFKKVDCTNRPAGEYTLKVGDKTTTVTLIDCDNKDTCNGGASTGSTTTGNTNQAIFNSGGAGEAKVLGTENQSSPTGNVSVQQSVPDTTAVVANSEDTTEMPSVQTSSFMDYIEAFLNWLGF